MTYPAGRHLLSLATSSQAAITAASSAASPATRRSAEPMTREQFRHARNDLIRRLRQPGESKSGEAGRALCSMYETLLRTADHPLVGKGIRDRNAFIQDELNLLEARAGGLADPASAAIELLKKERTKGNESIPFPKDEGSSPLVSGSGLKNDLFSAPQRTAQPMRGISSLETQAAPCDAPSLPTAAPAEFRSYAEFAEARSQLLLPSRLRESKTSETRKVLCSMYETVLNTPNHPATGQSRRAFIEIELKILNSGARILRTSSGGEQLAAPAFDAMALLDKALAKAEGPTQDDLLGNALLSATVWDFDVGPHPDKRLEDGLKSVFLADQTERLKHIFEKFCLSAEVPAASRQCAYLAFMRRRWPDAQSALRHVLEMQAFGAGSEPDDALDGVRFVPVLRAMRLDSGCDVAAASAILSRSPAPGNAQERWARLAEVTRLLTPEVD